MKSETSPNREPSGVTLHLVPEPSWQVQADAHEYRPESFAEEGFIHCTDGEALVIEVANRYYRDDPRPFLVLDVDLARVAAPAVYEDVERRYPHIYGPIEREAVARIRRVVRTVDGAFMRIGESVE